MNKLLIIFSLVALVGLSFADSSSSSTEAQGVSIKRKSSPPNDDGPAPGGIRPPKRVG